MSAEQHGAMAEFDGLLAKLREGVAAAEPWLTKKELAKHYACGNDGEGGDARSIEGAVKEGMPHAVIFGRVKFRVSETDPWLEQHGYLRRNVTGNTLAPTSNGAAPRERPAPDTRKRGPDVQAA
jgi:hypothetical protein